MGLDEPPTNVFYTVQPYYIDGHQYLKALAFTNLYTTHEFTWNPRTVQYRSWYGHSAQPTNAGAVIAEWTYEGDDVPNDTNEHVRMNLWMLDGIAPAIRPFSAAWPAANRSARAASSSSSPKGSHTGHAPTGKAAAPRG